MNTLERIQQVLKEESIAEWLIEEQQAEDAEAYFVKKALDTRRAKTVTKYAVTVFRRMEGPQGTGKGFTEVLLPAEPTDETLRREIKGAYYAAQFALNPDYTQPKAEKAPLCKSTAKMAGMPLAQVVGKLAEAAFAEDNRKDSYLNSLEIFAYRETHHVYSSEGTNVSWEQDRVDGEYVVQCKEPKDVELFYLFSYKDMETEALAAQVRGSLQNVADRAIAKRELKTGQYDVLLEGEDLSKLFLLHANRMTATAVFAGYSTWKVGDDIQHSEGGELLNLTMKGSTPYSDQGIRLKDMKLIENGCVKGYWGGNRFCQYIHIEPTGNYDTIVCDNEGTMTVTEMQEQVKKTGRPVLMPVLFSDFNVDPFTGNFGGEIRLAYLYDGQSVRPVTGGSVNGNVLEAQKTIRFSKERYQHFEPRNPFGELSYEGPLAALLENVTVAGV